MAPHIPSASLNLTYPIYASSFDPQNSNFLLVGGGGGEGRSGVGNKITLINASRREQLAEVHDIDLSRDEDSVTSLAVARSTKNSVTAFAGINSSSKEQAAGANEHLRSFRLNYPTGATTTEEPDPNAGSSPKSSKKKKKKVATEEKVTEKASDAPQALGKVGLFEPAPGSKETYQRVLRFSPAKGGSSALGVVATGLAPLGEVVVFDASKDTPTKSDIKQRITLQKGEEAADVDILQQGDSDFEIAYCTDYDVCISKVSIKAKAKAASPVCVYTTPHPDYFNAPKRAVFRALRWLTPRLLVLVQNLPKRTGTEVLLLDVPEDRSRGGAILLRKRLHKGANSATSLATAFLPAATPTQNVQHVIAIAGQDISLTILTLDHKLTSNASLRFKTFSVLKEVHPVQMTSLAFSNFEPPKEYLKAGPQYLKLASTSMGSSVFVHSLSLMPYPPFAKEPPRYVLSSPAGKSELRQIGGSVLLTLVIVAFAGIAIQAMTEIRGGSPEYLGAKNWLSQSLREKIAVPYMFADLPGSPKMAASPNSASSSSSSASVASSVASAIVSEAAAAALPLGLQQALQDRIDPDKEGHAVIVHDMEGDVSAELHTDEEALEAHGRRWEDLEHHERKAWKDRITQAGHWAEDELETVLKGVFFGQLAGAVAGAING